MAWLPRVLIGQHGARMNIWASKSGKNVLTAPDADMLLTPTDPNSAFLAKGNVLLTRSGEAVTVRYGATLSEKPIVWPQVVLDNTSFVPPLQQYKSIGIAGGAGPRWQVAPGLSSFRVTNLKSVRYYFQYMILHYPVEG